MGTDIEEGIVLFVLCTADHAADVGLTLLFCKPFAYAFSPIASETGDFINLQLIRKPAEKDRLFRRFSLPFHTGVGSCQIRQRAASGRFFESFHGKAERFADRKKEHCIDRGGDSVFQNPHRQHPNNIALPVHNPQPD